ncbi:MAG: 16S rRNA (adenine(1518)-N(6)/adenine(1519)-N(6))-dimethyltransferase RsmA [Pelovirga sp.]
MKYQTKKRFGQHFLHDRGVIEKIIAAARLTPEQRVLEIGPGLGVLTDQLLERVAEVVVMEIDRDLIAGLEQRRNPKLVIHQGDALQNDWVSLLCQPPYTLVANLPYNISSQVLFRLLDHRQLFSRLVLMFQREVAERLIASPGSKDYGILSVLCQLWFDMDKVTLVKPGAFNPPPRVDSMVLSFVPLATPRVDPVDHVLFTRLVKGSFTQRRKTLRNSLLASGFSGPDIDHCLHAAGIDPGCRGETLGLDQFAALTRSFLQRFHQNG